MERRSMPKKRMGFFMGVFWKIKINDLRKLPV
jgi:hypothetical protein